MSRQELAAFAIFALTYILLSARRLHVLPLGRPAAALLGAVLMVELGVLTPNQAYTAIDGDTIVLLLGMMILTAYLHIAGFFELVAHRVFAHTRSRTSLLVWLTVSSGVLSALFVNDTICLVLTPLVVIVIDRGKLPPLPYLLAVAMGSNVGSVATLTGNPQNMLIGSLSGQSYGEFFLHLLPVAAPALALTALILCWFFRTELSAGRIAEPSATPVLVDRKLLRLTLSVAVITMIGFFAGGHLAWTALAGAAAVMVLSRRDPAPALARVDWNVLLFFAALFVVVGGINRTSLPAEIFRVADTWLAATAARQASVLAVLSAVGSNVVSNVPFILLVEPWVRTLVEPELMWRVLAMSTTFAGNLTLLGSVANIIVFESARHVCPIGFWEYARVGIPITLVTTFLGTMVLCAVHAAW